MRRKLPSFVLTTVLVILLDSPQAWSAADPCLSDPCGEGAVCQLRSNLAVCLCPSGTSGDPFTKCAREGETTSKSETSTSSSSSTQHLSSSTSTSHPTTSSYDHANTANHFRVTYENPAVRPSTPISTVTEYVEKSPFGTTTTRIIETHHGELDHLMPHQGDHLRPIEHRVEYEDSRRNSPYAPYRPDDQSPRNSYDSMRGDNYHNDRQHAYENRFDYHRRPIHAPNSHVIFESNNDRRTTYDGGNNFRFETDVLRRGDNEHHTEHRNDGFDNSYYSHNSGRIHMEPVRRTGDENRFSFPTSSTSSAASHKVDTHSSSVTDPFGRYKNCITVRGVVVCADESDLDSVRPVSHPSSSNVHHTISTSSPIFRDDNSDFRREQSNIKFSDRLGEAQGNPKETYGGHPEGTIYSEIVLRSDDHRPTPAHAESKSPVTQPGDPEQCKKFCGVNAVCRSMLGRAICGCPEGYTGDASVRCVPEEEQERMKNRCHKHADCAENEICKDSQCTNPCAGSPRSISINTSQQQHPSQRQHRMKRMNHFSESSRRIDGDDTRQQQQRRESGMCGENTKCEVVGHTPLCGCLDGFTGNPYFGCVPANRS